jgi:isopropylmalate/homocitrate/citramalate synthase
VEIWLEKLGLKATPEQILEMVNKIKEKALKTQELLAEEDFRAIYKEVVG